MKWSRGPQQLAGQSMYDIAQQMDVERGTASLDKVIKV